MPSLASNSVEGLLGSFLGVKKGLVQLAGEVDRGRPGAVLEGDLAQIFGRSTRSGPEHAVQQGLQVGNQWILHQTVTLVSSIAQKCDSGSHLLLTKQQLKARR